MAGQGEGWPMGLQPVSRIRVGFTRNREISAGSVSFNALLTSSPTSSNSSSDLDTESTGSFFHDRSITLGRLIGASVMLDFSRRSMRGRNRKPGAAVEGKKGGEHRTRPCLFPLCLGEDSIDVESGNIGNAVAASSLGHFLAVERKAAAHGKGRGIVPPMYGLDEKVIEQAASRPLNSLFVDGRIAPPRTSPGTSPRVNGGCESGIGAAFCCFCMR